MDDDYDDDDTDDTDDIDDTYDRCAYLDRLVAVMRRHGWATRYVPGVPGSPSHAYTVGLFEYDAPEAIVFGLPLRSADGLLARIGGRTRDGARFRHGQVLDDLVPPLRVMLLDVADTSEHLPDACGFVEPAPPGKRSLRAWQIVYPDDDGLWPWQPGSRVADLPLLGLIPEGV